MGLFITVEGGEGCGKTSVMEEVKKRLEDKGYTNIISSREPGGVRIAEQIRKITGDFDNANMDPITEMFLYAAARRQHVVEKILPALAQNKIIICDRFIDSSYVYQGIAGNVGLDTVIKTNEIAIGEAKPDLTILFDLDPRIGQARIMANKSREVNRYDVADLKYLDAIREGYLELAKMFPERIKVIDASKTFEEVVEDVYKVLEEKVRNA